MSTKDIRTTYAEAVCDICGRTLLRGERAEMFVHGSTRHAVCELCKTRALHEGWVREGAVTDRPQDDPEADRRRGGLRWPRRRRGERQDGARRAPATLDEELSASEWEIAGPEPAPPPPPPPPRERIREPRHVRAVPMGDEHKVAAAMAAFNTTEHRRTVAGVARSLGAPAVKVLPDAVHPALVRIVVAWELCWYRYEVDLSEQDSSVRLDAQGYELDELSDVERVPNAAADELGQLHLSVG